MELDQEQQAAFMQTVAELAQDPVMSKLLDIVCNHADDAFYEAGFNGENTADDETLRAEAAATILLSEAIARFRDSAEARGLEVSTQDLRVTIHNVVDGIFARVEQRQRTSS